MLRWSEASKQGWKSKGPRRQQAGSESRTAVDKAANLVGSGETVGGKTDGAKFHDAVKGAEQELVPLKPPTAQRVTHGFI
jgi:hypothetical protein